MTFQDQLTTDEYSALMKDGLEDLANHRLNALTNVEANKARVARWYDKKVKVKAFTQGDLVWKLILPIGSKDPKFGKWSRGTSSIALEKSHYRTMTIKPGSSS